MGEEVDIVDKVDSVLKNRCSCTFLPPFLLMILVQHFMLIKFFEILENH